MSYTVERLHPPAPAIKAAEHSTDHERHGREHFGGAPHDKDRQRHDKKQTAAEEPAVLVDAHHDTKTGLDGVAAYQATAQHAQMALQMRQHGASHLHEDDEMHLYPANAAPRNAYADHEDDEDEHKVNLAT